MMISEHRSPIIIPLVGTNRIIDHLTLYTNSLHTVKCIIITIYTSPNKQLPGYVGAVRRTSKSPLILDGDGPIVNKPSID